MKTHLFTIVIILTAITVNGQITFQKTYGGDTALDIGNSVQQTIDGGYILFGQTERYGNDGQDMYLIKTDNQGYEQWYQTYGGTGTEFGISVQQITDGGYILCGGYSGLGNDSLALIKTDTDGNEVWNKRYSGSIDRDVGQFVQQTSDDGFIAVGFTGPDFAENIYIIKTDIDGNEQWSKVYNSTGREYAVGVRQTSDGGYAIIGETNSKGNGGKDMYLVKTNNIGDTSWTKTYGTSADEIGRSLYVTSDGGFILLGYEWDTPGGNLYLVKTDQLGNEQWSKYYGGTEKNRGHSVQQTSDNGYVLAGQKVNTTESTADMYCIKTDNNGIIQWEYTYPKGIASDAYSVQQTTDGGYILLGSTFETMGVDFNTDMYLVKINASGTLSITNNNNLPLKIKAYPNPFTESAIIEFNNSKNKEFVLTLLNVQGQLVRTINGITSEKVTIGRGNLTNGMYFYKLLSENQVIAAGKLIIN